MKTKLLLALFSLIPFFLFSQGAGTKKEKEIVKPLDFFLFGGTNIDPLGQSAVTSTSFELIKRLNFSNKPNGWQGRFGFYTNKNSIADSTSFNTLYFSPDVRKGLKEGESIIYTQKYDIRVTHNIRAWGGYFNIISPSLLSSKSDGKNGDVDDQIQNTLIKAFGGIEFTYREQTGVPEIKNSEIIDSTVYTKDFSKVIGSMPISTDRTIIPTRLLYQTFFSAGLIFENYTTNCEFFLQPSLGWVTYYEIVKKPTLSQTLDTKGHAFVAVKAFIRVVPSNIIIAGDLKSFGKGNMYFNLSIGLPIDISSIIKK